MIEIVAKIGYILTQSGEVAEEERIYVRRVFTHDASLWVEILESDMPKSEFNTQNVDI